MGAGLFIIIFLIQTAICCVIPLILRLTVLKNKRWTKGGTIAFAIANALFVEFVYIFICMMNGDTPQSLMSADLAGAVAGYLIIKPEKKEDAEEDKW